MAQFFDLRFDRLNFEASLFLAGRFFTVFTTFGLSICGDDTVAVLVTPVSGDSETVSMVSKPKMDKNSSRSNFFQIHNENI